jgi:hypothetical protein
LIELRQPIVIGRTTHLRKNQHGSYSQIPKVTARQFTVVKESVLPDKGYFFIIGAPRSGTTWLQAMLGSHPRVCTTVELTLFDKYTAPWIETWRRESRNIEEGRWHQGLPFVWDEAEFYYLLGDFVKRVYRRVLDFKPDATHVLDKHPGYSLYVDDIHRILPEARFIHVLRDGRDVAVSMIAARRRAGFGPGTIPDAARLWKQSVLGAKHAGQYEGRYLEVRYEQMLADGEDILSQVLDFCGLSSSAQEVAAIWEEHQFDRMKQKRQTGDPRVQSTKAHYRKGKAGSWREELSATQRCVFHQVTGDLLEELGYAEEKWWAASRWQERALPIIARAELGSRRAKRRILSAGAVLLGPRLAERVKASQRARR